MKVIPNTNNRYYATEDGHIYDDIRKSFIAENLSKRGWLKCHIWYKDKRITIGVHRLIAYAFLGESILTVNHKDGNKTNNHIDNLEYMTVCEQNLHRSLILQRGNRRKVRCLENDKIYNTILEAAQDLELKDTSHISAVCKGKYGFKSVYGYHFEYVD